MKRFLEIVAIVALAVVGSGPLHGQSNSLVGTWKLNVAKSKFNPGPALKSMTRTVEAQGDGVKYTFEGVAADGTVIAYGFFVSIQLSPSRFLVLWWNAAQSAMPLHEIKDATAASL